MFDRVWRERNKGEKKIRKGAYRGRTSVGNGVVENLPFQWARTPWNRFVGSFVKTRSLRDKKSPAKTILNELLLLWTSLDGWRGLTRTNVLLSDTLRRYKNPVRFWCLTCGAEPSCSFFDLTCLLRILSLRSGVVLLNCFNCSLCRSFLDPIACVTQVFSESLTGEKVGHEKIHGVVFQNPLNISGNLKTETIKTLIKRVVIHCNPLQLDLEEGLPSFPTHQCAIVNENDPSNLPHTSSA
uniref:Tuber storage protein n=1 Tax=Colocasia esculenta var. antiquorum TaxID=1419728 RepID=A0A024F971_COLES|nr:tuber storage protein [Colocasia esculenta var. antiquorum]